LLSVNATQRIASIVESSDDAIVSKDLNGIIISWNKGGKLLLDQTVKLGSSPARFHEQPVDVRQRLDAALYCVLDFGRVGVGKMHGRLHGRQYVLDSVLGFASENDDLRLATLSASSAIRPRKW
jgi:PAS domain-containing protein